jgi:hypothetical protein
VGWISALRSPAIRDLVKEERIQMSLFDIQGFAEISSPEYPGERLIACFNPLLAEERTRKRNDLLEATGKKLAVIVRSVAKRTKTPLGKAEIGKKVGSVINTMKMGKHFTLTIEDGFFAFARNEESIRQEEALDGIYVIRTSEPEERLSSDQVIRNYKNLSQVERVFKTFKGIDLLVRPIWHRTPDHVKAHIFLCMLAYYVEWHMRKALASLLFADEELPERRTTRDPVNPAEASPSAKKKKARKLTPDGLPVQSFSTLLAELGSRCRNRCRIASDPTAPAFTLITDPTPLQKRALELLGV